MNTLRLEELELRLLRNALNEDDCVEIAHALCELRKRMIADEAKWQAEGGK